MKQEFASKTDAETIPYGFFGGFSTNIKGAGGRGGGGGEGERTFLVPLLPYRKPLSFTIWVYEWFDVSSSGDVMIDNDISWYIYVQYLLTRQCAKDHPLFYKFIHAIVLQILSCVQDTWFFNNPTPTHFVNIYIN